MFLKESDVKIVERPGRLKQRLKAALLCALGVVLGGIYIVLGVLPEPKGEDGMLIFVMGWVLLLPALYLLAAGRKTEINRYEQDYDDILIFVPLIAIGADGTLLIIKFVLLTRWFHWLSWLPDLLIDWIVAAACLRNAYLWANLVRVVPPPPSDYYLAQKRG